MDTSESEQHRGEVGYLVGYLVGYFLTGLHRETPGDQKEASPICSTMSGGNTREAKALRKMSENSLSRPPIPIFSKFQSGLMMDWRDSRVLDFPE